MQVVLSRKEVADPTLRFAAQTRCIVADGRLTGSLRIADAIAPVDVCADLRASQVTVAIEVDAPREGRSATRINWLVRQLGDAPGGLRIDAYAVGVRTSASELLRVVREQPAILLADPKRELRLFRVAATSPMGTKRGVGRGSFIDSVLTSVDGFYAAVVQQLRPWTAKAPQLPGGGRTAAEESGLDLTPPPKDLDEPDSEMVDEAIEEQPASEFADAVATVEVERVDPPSSEPGVVEFVAWDDAQSRLDHERELEEGASKSTEVVGRAASPAPSA